MSTVAMVDKRKAIPKVPNVNSFWVTSDAFGKDEMDKGVLLFVFPKEDGIPASSRHTPYGILAADSLAKKFGETYIVEQVVLEITAIFDGTTPTVDVGVGSIADIDETTDNNITYSNNDGLLANASVTETSTGLYGSKFDGASNAIIHFKETITCDDGPVPCIFTHVQSGSADMSTGAAKLHVKLTRLGDSI